MKQINFKEMYNAGVHLGSSVKTINPKMKPYIMCTHDGIAIIDILKTYTRLFRVTLFLKKVIATEGYQVLFVGTQKSIAPLIADIATKSSSPYVNKRWKGGFLTNFKTIKGQTKNEPRSSIRQENGEKSFQTRKESEGSSSFRRAVPEDSFFSKDPKKKGDSLRSLETIGAQAFNSSNQNSEKVSSIKGSSSLSSSKEEKKGKFDRESRVSALTKSEEITKFTHTNELTILPDIVIIVGQQKELKAVKECQKLRIPTITILDSDGDPQKTSLFIPANDDSWTSVEFILKHLGHSILVGRLLYDKVRTHQF